MLAALAGGSVIVLSGCAGAYVAGDIGAHKDQDHVSRLDKSAPRPSADVERSLS
jgi:hypothetical protein